MIKHALFTLSFLNLGLNAMAATEPTWQEKLQQIGSQAQNKINEYKQLTIEEAVERMQQELAAMDKSQLEAFIENAKTYLQNFDEEDKERILSTAKEYLAKAEAGFWKLKEISDKNAQ